MIELKKNWREKVNAHPKQGGLKANWWGLGYKKFNPTALTEFIEELNINKEFRLAAIAESGKRYEQYSRKQLRAIARKWRNDHYHNTVITYRYVDYYQSKKITTAPSVQVAIHITETVNQMLDDMYYNEPPVRLFRARRNVWLHVQRRKLQEMEELLPVIGEVVLNIYKNFSY